MKIIIYFFILIIFHQIIANIHNKYVNVELKSNWNSTPILLEMT